MTALRLGWVTMAWLVTSACSGGTDDERQSSAADGGTSPGGAAAGGASSGGATNSGGTTSGGGAPSGGAPSDGGATSGGAPAERKGIIYTADFETGKVQAVDEKIDGAYVKGMAPPLDGTCTPVSTTKGTGALESKDYTRVVDSTVVPPMTGNNSLQMQIPYDCDYNPVNGGTAGDIGGDLDKARTGFGVNGDDFALPFDEYVWIGYGMHLPVGFETETEQVDLHIIQHPMGPSGAPGAFGMTISKNTELQIDYAVNPNGINHDGSTKTIAKILDWTAYVGRWVPVIFRVRMNPYSQQTDSSKTPGSTGQTYQGNRGDFEVWLDDVKVVDLKEPIGFVPSPDKWRVDLLVYKGNWKKKPSSVDGPITIYYDALRIGLESQGAGYSDVHPLQHQEP